MASDHLKFAARILLEFVCIDVAFYLLWLSFGCFDSFSQFLTSPLPYVLAGMNIFLLFFISFLMLEKKWQRFRRRLYRDELMKRRDCAHGGR